MAAGSDAFYAEVLDALSTASAVVQRLEARPQSAKRDLALSVLRRELARALGRVGRLPSSSHRN